MSDLGDFECRGEAMGAIFLGALVPILVQIALTKDMKLCFRMFEVTYYMVNMMMIMSTVVVI